MVHLLCLLLGPVSQGAKPLKIWVWNCSCEETANFQGMPHTVLLFIQHDFFLHYGQVYKSLWTFQFNPSRCQDNSLLICNNIMLFVFPLIWLKFTFYVKAWDENLVSLNPIGFCSESDRLSSHYSTYVAGNKMLQTSLDLSFIART